MYKRQYLPRALQEVLEGTLGVFGDRLGRLLFKLVVEHNMTNHLPVSYTHLCCNEEGNLNGMKPNRWLEDDIICGPFFLVGDDHEGGFCSLTDEQLDRYTPVSYTHLLPEKAVEDHRRKTVPAEGRK